ncbi:MAG: hypothetical protein ACI8VT_004140 [Saprospiraceae bacterium]|jgi:hypothetical protein
MDEQMIYKPMNLKQACAISFLLLFLQLDFAQSFKIYFPDNGVNNIVISEPENIIISGNIPFNGNINFQAGFSPFKNISISGGIIRKNTIKDDWGRFIPEFQELIINRKAITGAIGAYHFFDLRKGKNTDLRKTKEEENIG